MRFGFCWLKVLWMTKEIFAWPLLCMWIWKVKKHNIKNNWVHNSQSVISSTPALQNTSYDSYHFSAASFPDNMCDARWKLSISILSFLRFASNKARCVASNGFICACQLYGSNWLDLHIISLCHGNSSQRSGDSQCIISELHTLAKF